MEQIYIPKQDYKVLVRCFTYNQSKYIEDALNGFAMQQTSFPFICLVMDDCSTDNEPYVINSWMECECNIEKAVCIDLYLSKVIIVPHKTNDQCCFAFYLLKRNLYKEEAMKWELVNPWRDHCEYEALCEGDDYWIDPLKLQKQADILDARGDCSFVHTAFTFFHESDGRLYGSEVMRDLSTSEMIEKILDHNKYRVQTATVMMRSLIAKKIFTENSDCFNSSRFLMGDTQLWTLSIINGYAYYLQDNTSVYRVNTDSACRSTDLKKQLRFDASAADMRVYMTKRLLPQSQLLETFMHQYNIAAFRFYIIDHTYKFQYKLELKYRLLAFFCKFSVINWIFKRRYYKC